RPLLIRAASPVAGVLVASGAQPRGPGLVLGRLLRADGLAGLLELCAAPVGTLVVWLLRRRPSLVRSSAGRLDLLHRPLERWIPRRRRREWWGTLQRRGPRRRSTPVASNGGARAGAA